MSAGRARRPAENRAELRGGRQRDSAGKRGKRGDEQQFVSDHQGARRFGRRRLYARPRERLVNTVNTAGKGRREMPRAAAEMPL